MKISQRYRDQPKRPLDTAIYWVEYVARHGAYHMHNPGQDLSFMEYHHLDILAATVLTVWFGWIVVFLIKKIIINKIIPYHH